MENIMKNIKNIRLLTTVFALLLTAYSLQLISPAHASSYIAEPTGIAVGARALSLGRAYVGIAENGEAVYFVQDNWYQQEYVPRYQEQHREYREQRGDGRQRDGEHRGNRGGNDKDGKGDHGRD